MNFPKANSFPTSVMRERSMGPNPLKLCEELLAYGDIPASETPAQEQCDVTCRRSDGTALSRH
jgi:hypothetical protein